MSFLTLANLLRKENLLKVNLDIFAKYLLQNDLMNIVYEIEEENNEEPTIRVAAVGIPKQLLDMIRLSLNQPIEHIDYPILQLPVLRRVYAEKKPIYFQKVPDLAGVFIPSLKVQQQVKTALYRLGITDIGAAPIFITDSSGKEKFHIICVLGPLSTDQKQFVKNSIMEFENFHNS